jgi:hypothetical protein
LIHGQVLATTLVVLVGKHTVVIGADSLRTGGGVSTAICKITRAGSMVFGFSGLTNAGQYDAISLARSEVSGVAPSEAVVDRALEAVRVGLAARYSETWPGRACPTW